MVQIEKCLICDDKVSESHKPFCSRRCKDIDLGKWFNEGYRIPSAEKLRVIRQEETEVDEP